MDKNCPFFTLTLITNYENDNINNTKLFSRNFPSDTYNIDVDFRPGFTMCTQSYCNSKPIENKRKERACLFPGKGSGSEYRQLVDLESELKRISNNNLREPLVLQNCCNDFKQQNTMPLSFTNIEREKSSNLCMRGQNICTRYDITYKPEYEKPIQEEQEIPYFNRIDPPDVTIYNNVVNKSLKQVMNNPVCQNRNLVIGQEQDLHNKEGAWNNYTSRKINELY